MEPLREGHPEVPSPPAEHPPAAPNPLVGHAAPLEGPLAERPLEDLPPVPILRAGVPREVLLEVLLEVPILPVDVPPTVRHREVPIRHPVVRPEALLPAVRPEARRLAAHPPAAPILPAVPRLAAPIPPAVHRAGARVHRAAARIRVHGRSPSFEHPPWFAPRADQTNQSPNAYPIDGDNAIPESGNSATSFTSAVTP